MDGRQAPLPFLWGVDGERHPHPHTCRALVPFQSHTPARADPSPGGRERSVSRKTGRVCEHDATGVVIKGPSVDFAFSAASPQVDGTHCARSLLSQVRQGKFRVC